MFRNTPNHQHSWQDFAKVLEYIYLYVRIEEKKCDANDLKKLKQLGLQNDKASADYIRSDLYPAELRNIGCVGGRHFIGRESGLYFAYDFDDVDEFFSEFVPTQGHSDKRDRLETYLAIVKIISENQTKPIPRHYYPRRKSN